VNKIRVFGHAEPKHRVKSFKVWRARLRVAELFHTRKKPARKSLRETHFLRHICFVSSSCWLRNAGLHFEIEESISQRLEARWMNRIALSSEGFGIEGEEKVKLRI
jgi:hypothetical protein